MDVWYELLHEAGMNERVNYQGKNKTLQDAILSVQYKGLALFTGVE